MVGSRIRIWPSEGVSGQSAPFYYFCYIKCVWILCLTECSHSALTGLHLPVMSPHSRWSQKMGIILSYWKCASQKQLASCGSTWTNTGETTSSCTDSAFTAWDAVYLCVLYYRGGGFPGYDIISAFPQCCYNDDSQTLQSCGLTTNTTLLLRKRKHPHSLTQVNKLKL